MTWLDRLEAVFGARTKGPWIRLLDTVQQSVSHEHPVRICIMTGDTRAVFQNDQDFIAISGTAADEVLAVIKAASALSREDSSPVPDSVMRKEYRRQLSEALANLAKKVEETNA